mmetsp:Transcript_48398/g.149565  ORF Transcript_48398/g.149565 Transcript_48398/m.149565 type:complete len:233 (+) Transcript_48398:570-1268(+)
MWLCAAQDVEGHLPLFLVLRRAQLGQTVPEAEFRQFIEGDFAAAAAVQPREDGFRVCEPLVNFAETPLNHRGQHPHEVVQGHNPLARGVHCAEVLPQLDVVPDAHQEDAELVPIQLLAAYVDDRRDGVPRDAEAEVEHHSDIDHTANGRQQSKVVSHHLGLRQEADAPRVARLEELPPLHLRDGVAAEWQLGRNVAPVHHVGPHGLGGTLPEGHRGGGRWRGRAWQGAWNCS